MAVNVRYWGGPACGKTCQIEDSYANVPSLRVRMPVRLDPMAAVGNEHSAMSQEYIQTDDYEYNLTCYKDSQGIQVYIMPDAGKWVIEHFEELRREFYIKTHRQPKTVMLPRPVWHDLDCYMTHNHPMAMRSDNRLVTGSQFRGLKIVYGDGTMMLEKAPEEAQYFRHWGNFSQLWHERDTARPERDPEEVRREYEGEWPMDMPQVRDVDEGRGNPAIQLQPYQRALLSAFDEGRPVQFVRPRNYGASEMMWFMQGLMYAEGERATPDQTLRPSSHPTISRIRRNRTQIHSGNEVRSMFRLIFENGPKLTQEKKDRLHSQYKQSIKNWGMQFIENSDLL